MHLGLLLELYLRLPLVLSFGYLLNLIDVAKQCFEHPDYRESMPAKKILRKKWCP
jgi:hypothetical protein